MPINNIGDGTGRQAFVVKIDGIDGCGKTSLINALVNFYRDRMRILVTSEFNSSMDRPAVAVSADLSVSQVLNRLAKCGECDLDDIERELLWAVASRRVNRIVIERERKLQDLIFVDRSNLGNLTYGFVFDPRLIAVYDLATSSMEKADLIFWIDTPVEVCMSRLEKRPTRDVIEAKGFNFFSQVREQYAWRVDRLENAYRLDGADGLGALTRQAVEIINKKTKV